MEKCSLAICICAHHGKDMCSAGMSVRDISSYVGVGNFPRRSKGDRNEGKVAESNSSQRVDTSSSFPSVFHPFPHGRFSVREAGQKCYKKAGERELGIREKEAEV